MLTTDKQQYKPGSLLELAKKKLAEKESATNAQNQRASSLMTNPYTKVSTPYNQIKQEPTPPEPTLLQNAGQIIKEQGVAGTVAEGGRVAGGAVGDVLGRIVGAATGAILGFTLKPDADESRIKNALDQARKSSSETRQFGREIVGGALSMFPAAIQTIINVGKMGAKVVTGREQEFVDYVAQNNMKDVPYMTIEQARNNLLTGNLEGDLNKINKNEIIKAWYAGLLSTGIDMWMASSLATSAFNNYYTKNPTKGYKPTESLKMDFDKGVAELVKKDQAVRTELFKPQPGKTGTLEITKAEPTIGRKLASPLTELNKPLVRSQYTPAEQARLEASGGAPAQTTGPIAALREPFQQLEAGTGKASVPPVQDSRAAFQMIDPKAAKTATTLKAKLEKAIADKQTLIAKGASPTVIQQVKDLQAIISKIDSKLQTAEQKSIVATGPIVQGGSQIPSNQPIVSQEPIKTPIQEVKPSTPTVTPVKAPKAITSKIAKTPQGTIVKETTLYHGSDAGKLKIDKNGNINLSPSKDQITQFGSPLSIDITGMKVMEFPTKEELFKASENKGYYSRKGIDILISGNHAIAINPVKFATK
ncbi:MAG: hypothetical protein WC511_07040, partial [Candidatus Pacearchaeota archaeon]